MQRRLASPETRPPPGCGWLPTGVEHIMPPMLRAALISFLIALAGIMILATGAGTFGPCGDLPGLYAFYAAVIGGFVGSALLLISGARAGWRRWKHSRSQATSG